MHRLALELMEKALGLEHPDTLDCMDNLALVLESQGKDEEDKLAGMNNLAVVLQSQGKHQPFLDRASEHGLSPVRDTSKPAIRYKCRRKHPRGDTGQPATSGQKRLKQGTTHRKPI
jgi:hypothetical protein